MSLSEDFVDAHIATWQANLSKGGYPYRAKWPSRLFHHTPLENAVNILKGNCLRSRSDPANNLERDVAAASVNDTRTHAHGYVRFYFRPRTPTQYNIEGVRKTGECRYGDETHAPVLFMLVFKCRGVLTLPGVRFSNQNMQIVATVDGEDEEYFRRIPFEKVFHMGAIGGDYSIISHRCAEVLAPSPLPLEDHLQWIYCRSEAERETLLYRLGDDASSWNSRIKVSDDLRVFEKDYVFVEEIRLSKEGVTFQLHPRKDHETVDIRITLWNPEGRVALKFENSSLAAVPPKNKRWIFRQPLSEEYYRVRVRLEGHIAYEGQLRVANELI
ncbi:DarT ssDNA thymidine ADP-ribosyltransferase family protein [Aurantimonas coralicida]|uniref:DarT ssDNA thymidine ADP-ribosyltransferase family protein n=1 Tax=Aurantimonas coralicida TaxID=182270 RepID=UPI001D18174E|nr:DarT ssDNA thymidine ADP-ribosyltransferase family protein [Aurantimonas coralicida]MCC4299581.1 DUF4433 domain-containing protein [Aurantimonas coralicida]